MAANNNPVSLAWLAKNPKAAIGFMADKSNLFKSLAARMINAQAETTIPSLGLLARPSGIAISQDRGLLDYQP
jgi:hypothetical protein